MSKRSAKIGSARRARLFTAIGKRDNWTCYYCEEKIDWKLYKTGHPEAPSLDHIKRRRDGGDNTQDNLRLMHRICNEIRN